MPANGNERIYNLGATTVVVGLSATVAVDISVISKVLSCQLRPFAGSGTLSIVNGPSNIVTQGYALGAGEVVEIDGPAKFYLAAGGATMSVGVLLKYGQGLSSTINGVTPPA